MKHVLFISRTIKILISNWPRTRKFSQLLQAGKTVAFDFSPMFTRWSRSTSIFYALIWNLFNLTAEAGRVWCQLYGRPFVSKLWHNIRAVFPHVYLQSFLLHDIRAFFVSYTCVLSCFVGFLFLSIWPFSYKRAYICAQKSPHIRVTNKHVVYGVTESRSIRGTELYRQ